jgi:hypothetical protein
MIGNNRVDRTVVYAAVLLNAMVLYSQVSTIIKQKEASGNRQTWAHLG